jgi:hypothetical protein
MKPTGTLNMGYLYGLENRKRVYVHREAMEKFIGRKLNGNERVHHKNGDKTDNRLENLEVMTTSEHMRLHTTKRIKNGWNPILKMERDWHCRVTKFKTIGA